jgi:hypothetical protein
VVEVEVEADVVVLRELLGEVVELEVVELSYIKCFPPLHWGLLKL